MYIPMRDFISADSAESIPVGMDDFRALRNTALALRDIPDGASCVSFSISSIDEEALVPGAMQLVRNLDVGWGGRSDGAEYLRLRIGEHASARRWLVDCYLLGAVPASNSVRMIHTRAFESPRAWPMPEKLEAGEQRDQALDGGLVVEDLLMGPFRVSADDMPFIAKEVETFAAAADRQSVRF
jgi:hypothetical protein